MLAAACAAVMRKMHVDVASSCVARACVPSASPTICTVKMIRVLILTVIRSVSGSVRPAGFLIPSWIDCYLAPRPFAVTHFPAFPAEYPSSSSPASSTFSFCFCFCCFSFCGCGCRGRFNIFAVTSQCAPSPLPQPLAGEVGRLCTDTCRMAPRRQPRNKEPCSPRRLLRLIMII